MGEQISLNDAFRQKYAEFIWLLDSLKERGVSPDQAAHVACAVYAGSMSMGAWATGFPAKQGD